MREQRPRPLDQLRVFVRGGELHQVGVCSIGGLSSIAFAPRRRGALAPVLTWRVDSLANHGVDSVVRMSRIVFVAGRSLARVQLPLPGGPRNVSHRWAQRLDELGPGWIGGRGRR